MTSSSEATADRARTLSRSPHSEGFFIQEEARPGISGAAYAIALYAFIIISRVADLLPSLHLGAIAATLAIMASLPLPALGRQRLLALPQVRLAVTLFVVAALTIPLAIWPGGSFDHVTQLYSKVILLFVLVSYGVRTLPEVRALVVAAFAAALLLEVAEIVHPSPERDKLVVATYDANDVAFVLICLLPLASAFFARTREWTRWIAGAAAILAVAAIVVTRSRGGFVSLCVISAVLAVRLPTRRWDLRIALFGTGFLIFTLFASEQYWARIDTIWDSRTALPEEYDAGGLAAARLSIWSKGVQLFFEHPILGVGAGGFETAEGLSHGGEGKWNAAHNAFLQIAVDLGAVGLILFVALLRRGIRDCRELVRRASERPDLEAWVWLAYGVEVSLYGFIVAGMTLSQGYSYVLYFLIAITAVMRRATLSDEPPAEAPR